MSFQHIGFIGFGLIGGSIARAVKADCPDCKITVSSRSAAPLQQALEDHVIDNISLAIDDTFSECDLIILCTPVITITEYLRKLKPVISSKCIITDVGSVKGYIHDAVKELDMESCFIGGHPMAGSQLTGYLNSSADILINAKYILTPTQYTTKEQLDALKNFIIQIKSEPVVMDVHTHDRTVAGISHIPHLSACALTRMAEQNDDEMNHMHLLAAGGFKDTTRIAASSPEMWEQICETNGTAISELLSSYIDILSNIKSSIDQKNTAAVQKLFTDSRNYRNTFE